MRLVRAPIVATLVALSGCATLQQVLALRNVEFTVDRVADLRVAGVDIAQVTSFADLGFADAARLTRALAERDLRVDFPLLRPGVPTDVPVTIGLNLVEFFDCNGPDLVELALSLAGQGSAPKEATLQATPIAATALGPIRYPRDHHRESGGRVPRVPSSRRGAPGKRDVS